MFPCPQPNLCGVQTHRSASNCKSAIQRIGFTSTGPQSRVQAVPLAAPMSPPGPPPPPFNPPNNDAFSSYSTESNEKNPDDFTENNERLRMDNLNLANNEEPATLNKK